MVWDAEAEGEDRANAIREHKGKRSVCWDRAGGKTWLCFRCARVGAVGILSAMLYMNLRRNACCLERALSVVIGCLFPLCPEASEVEYYLFQDEPQRVDGGSCFCAGAG
jgi:hypothetical protein